MKVSDRNRIRAAMLMEAAKFVPQLVRDDLLSNAELRNSFDLRLDARIGFEMAGIAFKRSTLYEAVRRAGKHPGKQQKVLDFNATECHVTVEAAAEGSIGLVIKTESKVLHADLFLLLCKNKRLREKFLSVESERLNLPRASIARWQDVIGKRPLSDDEIDDFRQDASSTTVTVTETILQGLRRSKIRIEELVPHSLVYFERLVGRVGDQENIGEFAEHVAAAHIGALLTWRKRDGLYHALLTGSHIRVTEAIARQAISPTDFEALLLWAIGSDDISRVVTLELAISNAQEAAASKQSIRKVAEAVLQKGGSQKYDSYVVLSAAFVMVYGELAKSRITAAKPAYWRRLAAFAQAALITRCVLETPGNLSAFVEWMSSVRLAEYEMQCLLDLRTNSRWLGDFGMAGPLRDHLWSRVLAVALSSESSIKELDLYDLLLQDMPSSLVNKLNPLSLLFPGALDANVKASVELPVDSTRKLRTELAETSPSGVVFEFVANSALLFELPDDIPRLAAEALRRAKHYLDFGVDNETLHPCLIGLALLAAIKKDDTLADEIFVVLRNYRRFLPDRLQVEPAFQIGMIACASRGNEDDWRKCVGALVKEIGFGDIDREVAARLYGRVIRLCDLEPKLWANTASGLAALEAVARL